MNRHDRRHVAVIAAAVIVATCGVAAAVTTGQVEDPSVTGYRNTSASERPASRPTSTASSPKATPTSPATTKPTNGSTPRKQAITGTVSAAGAPVGGIQVTLMADTGGEGTPVAEAVTTANGTFSFDADDAPDASYFVVADDPAGEHVATHSDTFGRDHRGRVPIAMKRAAVLEGDIVLKRSDGTSAPAARADVTVSARSGAGRYEAVADANGHFRIVGIAPGRYDFVIGPEGSDLLWCGWDAHPTDDDDCGHRTLRVGVTRVPRIVLSSPNGSDLKPTDPPPTARPTDPPKPQNEDPVSNS